MAENEGVHAFYGDGTGLCYWCANPVVADYFGVPVCEKHYDEESSKDFPPFV